MRSLLLYCCLISYAGEMAPLGQASTHVPQSAQVSGSIE